MPKPRVEGGALRRYPACGSTGERVSGGKTPYSDLPPQAFWRTGVAEPGLAGLRALWSSRWALPADARFATFGSCFAQHIGRALTARGQHWLDAEPAPGRTPPEIARAFNYGVFSARTGNIYTAAQLLLLVRLAAGEDDPDLPEFWPDGARVADSLRPAIEPSGFASAEEARLSRLSMVRAFRRAIAGADVFVFTLGLTEGWENAATGQPYAMCPGTAAGSFDPARHRFREYRFGEIGAALDQAVAAMRRINPGLRILLTVSPVPLTATASGRHVLVATTQSKAVLRAVAGELAAADAGVDYFPSYEIIAGAPAAARFYEANLRSVTQAGVDTVMGHFFAGLRLDAPEAHSGEAGARQASEAEAEARMAADDLVCEEQLLEAYARGRA
ncbi:GSCFA domain-containing protein [Albidovulum sp.]|uniref:GSCFA domain-containing protein n=1 Tax=Albidovulum sp. TaxID=1872424 RepID=UPI003030BF64